MKEIIRKRRLKMIRIIRKNDKVISEDEYKDLMGTIDNMTKTISSKDITIKQQKQEIQNLMDQVMELKKERTTLKSKVTKLENQQKNDKQLVKETLKEVHTIRKNRHNAKNTK